MVGFKNGSLLTRSISLDTDITSVQQVLGADSTRVGVINVNGDPEGVVSANPGSLGLDRTGSLYLKETGTGNTGWSRLDSGADMTITGDSGGPLAPSSGNWNFFGLGETSTSGAGSTLSFLSPRAAQWIVDPTANNGTHTTIASALSAASTGETILIRPGTYTENLTLKAGVNLAAYPGDEETPNVTIQGTCTATFAGTCTISGIRLQTNSAALLAVTGTSATIVNLENCYLDCTDNSGITFSSSSSSAQVNIYRCTGDLGTTGINFFAHSSAGFLQIFHSRITNTGASTTASTVSAGTFQSDFNALFFPITNSSTSVSVVQFTEINTNSINTTSFTNNSSDSNNTFRSCHLVSGTASPLSVGASAVVNVHMCTFDHTNATTIAGTGTVRYSNISKAGANANFALASGLTQTPRKTIPGAMQVTTPGAYPYSAKAQDGLILIDTSTTRTINLPSSPSTGLTLRLKDNVGSAATNNVTISPAAGNIDGAASYTLNVDYGSIDVCFTGSEWSIL